MSRSLLVPIQVDALYLTKDTHCAEARLNFSRLPYFNGQEDVNPNVAYLGEEIQAVPFKNGTFKLKKGVHLHWALPDALTRSLRHPLLNVKAARRLLSESEYDHVFSWGISKKWLREIDGSEYFASIIVDPKHIDGTIGGLLANPAAGAKVIGEHLRKIRHLLDPGGTQMPPTPNRWIITRNHGDDDAKNKRWLVESDFLAAAADGSADKGVAFPIWRESNTDAPFGWLGRQYEIAPRAGVRTTPPPAAAEDSYLSDPLTATGYGEPTFAAFYPNCHSVFGFHDDLIYQTTSRSPTVRRYDAAAEGFTYTIIGYYSDEYLDYLSILWNDNFSRVDPDDNAAVARELLAIYREELRFSFTYAPGQSTATPTDNPEAFLDHAPDNLLCGARLTLGGRASSWSPPPREDFTVAVGHSGTEALAAYLSRTLSRTRAPQLEDFFESLQLASSLDHLETDIGPKFQERRHEQGFTAEKGGWRWTLNPPTVAREEGAAVSEQVTLPDELAHFLHELNDLQRRYDHLEAAVQSIRQQIYADWTKYMLCQYPPEGDEEDYPDADEARFFIETELLPQLRASKLEQDALNQALREKVESFWLLRVEDVDDWRLLFNNLMQAMILYEGHPPESINMFAGISQKTIINMINGQLLQPGQPFGFLNTEPLPDSSRPSSNQDATFSHLAQNRRILEEFYPGVSRHTNLVLKLKPSAPFHRPVDPVILIAGDDLRLSGKHGQDGMLACHYEGSQSSYLQDVGVIDAWCNIIAANLPQQQQDASTNHPLLLDWLTEYFPALKEAETGAELQEQYALAQNHFDFDPSAVQVSASGHNFWGTAILTNHAGEGLKENLTAFILTELQKLDLARIYDQMNITDADQQTVSVLLERIERLNFHYFSGVTDPWFGQWFMRAGLDITGNDHWYRAPTTVDAYQTWDGAEATFPDGSPPPITLWESKRIALALIAYETLESTHYLSQALSGFHAALLMRRAGFQLNIDDPLGYPDYQAFSHKVRDAVGLFNHTSTLPGYPFFPLRAGACDLIELRLLDTFGLALAQPKGLEHRTVFAAEPLRPLTNDHHLHFPPRLTQSARLNFNWLSAEDDDIERNEHPASSPVCGWLLVNKMDGSLMIYDRAGTSLGYLDTEGRWRTAPGQEGPALPEGIANWHLRRMVLWLHAQARKQADPQDGVSDTIPHFIALIEEALTKIEPARSDHAGEGVAMLFSRPLALVRAQVQLELKGHPAYQQGWDAFEAVINDPTARAGQTHGLEKIAFPLRLGEDRQLNDGLIGFWEDVPGEEGYRDDLFRVPSLHRQTDGKVDTNHHVLDSLTVGTEGDNAPGIRFSLLMDPHGSVHATTGALPLQKLELPPDLYADALKHLEVSFLAAPILSSAGRVNISLPDEPGFSWSWVGMENRQWQEVSVVGHFRQRELAAVFGDATEDLWEALAANGWITLDGEEATIVPANKRPVNDTFPPAGQAPKLEQFLASRQISPFRMTPAFHGPQEVREGWLKLKPTPELPDTPTT